MNLAHTLVFALLALGPLIVFHELGHYLVARACGVRVLRFSVGFGRPLIRWQSPRGDRTEWIVAAIPLGGYVQMLDEREAPVKPSEVSRAFNRQSPWRRMAIVVAGPLANLLLASLVYAGLYLAGFDEPRAVIATPAAGSVAARAGLQSGDEILAVDDEPVRSWNDLRWLLIDRAIDHVSAELTLTTGSGGTLRRTIDFTQLDLGATPTDPWAPIGLSLYRPPLPAVIGTVEPGGAGDEAGLAVGDRVLAIEDQPVDDWEALVRAVRAHPGRTLQLERERVDGRRDRLVVTPASITTPGGEVIGRVGLAPRIDRERYAQWTVHRQYGPLEALVQGCQRMVEVSVFSVRMIGRMLTGTLSWRNLSGPVSIAEHAGQTARQGLEPFLLYVALMSISLGVLNLMPIPVLDGGHLLYSVCEVVRGRPLSERAIEWGQRIGLGILIALMAFSLFNDISRHVF
jgi:regulator of sigma E protease